MIFLQIDWSSPLNEPPGWQGAFWFCSFSLWVGILLFSGGTMVTSNRKAYNIDEFQPAFSVFCFLSTTFFMFLIYFNRTSLSDLLNGAPTNYVRATMVEIANHMLSFPSAFVWWAITGILTFVYVVSAIGMILGFCGLLEQVNGTELD